MNGLSVMLSALPQTPAGEQAAWFWRRLQAIADGAPPPERRELEEHYAEAWLAEVPVSRWFETLPPVIAAVRRVDLEVNSHTLMSALLDLGGEITLRFRCSVQGPDSHKIDFQVLSPAVAPSSYDDLLVERDGRVVHVRDFRGSGPPLLLWHGSGCDASVWEGMVPFLRDFRVLAQDLPGHGSSPLARLTVADAVADGDAVIAQLELPAPNIVGHSLGGWAALHFAATRPCNTLVCLDGPTNLAYEAMGLAPPHPGWVPDPPRVDADVRALRCPALMVLCSGRSPSEAEWMVPFRTGLSDHLRSEHPDIAVAWRAADHMIVLSQPAETAALIHRFILGGG